jgi:hypothetical protein
MHARFNKFLDFLGYTGTNEEKAQVIAPRLKADPVFAFNSDLKIFLKQTRTD